MDIVKAKELFIQRMISKNFSKNTIENYSSQLLIFLEKFKNVPRAKEISANEIEKYLLSIEKINTRKHSRCAIQSFYSLVVNQPLKLQYIPWPKKEVKLPQPLDISDVQKLFDVCTNKKHKSIISLLYGCGLRISEVLNLKIVDIDSTKNIINIIQGKGKKDRQVMLDSFLLKLLREYWLEYKPIEYLFNGQFGGRYSERSINSFLKKYATEAGIKTNVHAHLLRHSFATHCLEQGTDIHLIQKLLGHNNIKTTLIYTHVSSNLIANTVSPISKLNLN